MVTSANFFQAVLKVLPRLLISWQGYFFYQGCTMARLIVFRHGKTEIVSNTGRDFDRELVSRGQRNSVQMAGMIKNHMKTPDIVIVSPAMRTRQTAKYALPAMGYHDDPVIDERIYNATGDTLYDVLRDHAADKKTALIIGHNPGLIILMDILMSVDEDHNASLIADFPTASVGDVVFEADTFADVMPNSGKLLSLLRPRELGFNP